ncbi:DEAD/DEAH box helicase [Acetobacter musti]|uniref:DEAD/DEAH box helicase n=1 Tax=Acetobacter musti TaxID=864732 RepID=A0ABX0JLM7_9PROT|nr:DEAD/DEAH box helicase [Acetobacter musti]NHN83895.1 DEAD/DEAH box helicase [Acetobacter musti]
MSPKTTDSSEKKPRKAVARPRTRKAVSAQPEITEAAVGDIPAGEPVRKKAVTPRKRIATSVKKTAAKTAENTVPKEEKPAPVKAATRKTATKKAAPAGSAPKSRTTKAPRVKAEPVAEDTAPAAADALPSAGRKTPSTKSRTDKSAATKPRTRRKVSKPAKETVAPVATSGKIDASPEIPDAHPLHITGALDISEEVPPVESVVVGKKTAPTAEEHIEPAEKTDEPVFADLSLSEPILRAVSEMGYIHPTPIQAQAIPAVLHGQDVLGVAQTGTGKTASFTLPMLEILSGSRARARMPRSLILEPTRELALQVAENFVNYGKHLKLNHALLIGGESMADQKDVLNRGVDVLIATPGRLIDLFERGGLLLNQTRILVIDEADRMLDMGFIPDIERIVGLLPRTRQTLFFSATMAPEIKRLADAFLQSPREITVSRPSTVATTIETGLVIVDEHDKRKILRRLLRAENVQNAIVFCNRKRDVDILLKSLVKHGFEAGALHGDLPQSIRFQTLEKFKSGELKILVCSDVAARGIDIGGLSHVFNFDLPFHAEDYVHRIGRTGRAGREGRAYSLATPYERKFAEAIETLTGKTIPRLELAGVTQLDWSDEERPKDNRGRKKRRDDRGKGKTTSEQLKESPDSSRKDQETAPAPAVQEKRPERDNARQQDRRRDRRPRGSEIPDATAETVTGFGVDMPAFMSLPRRIPVHVDNMAEDAAES